MSAPDDDQSTKFDASDEVSEDTQPDAHAARRRRLVGGVDAASDAVIEMLRQEQRAFGSRLASLEGRMTTMVGRVIDLMVSDQDDHEVLRAVRKDLAETKEELKKLIRWLDENSGP